MPTARRRARVRPQLMHASSHPPAPPDGGQHASARAREMTAAPGAVRIILEPDSRRDQRRWCSLELKPQRGSARTTAQQAADTDCTSRDLPCQESYRMKQGCDDNRMFLSIGARAVTAVTLGT